MTDRLRQTLTDWGLALLLMVAGLAVYANGTSGEFIFDDFDTVLENPALQPGASLMASLWPGPQSPNTPLSGRPLVALSFALNAAFGGFEVRGYHLVNIAIHALAGLALFALVGHSLRLPRQAGRYGANANGYALAVALLWLVHPLQTEAVNYLTQRTELLMGLCSLLTLLTAAEAWGSPRPRLWQGLAVTACLAGMGAKEVTVSVPLLVALYDRLLVLESWRQAWQRRGRFYLALAATWLALLVFQLGSSRAATVRFDLVDLTALDYLRTQMGVILHYLRLVFWPWPLVLDAQDWPIVHHLSAALLGQTAIVGGLLLATAVGLWRQQWWALPGACFFAILAPTSSVLPVYTEIVAERRMYLPLAAVIIVVVFGTDALARRLWPERTLSRWLLGLTLTLAAIFSLLTWQRNEDYRTEIGLWIKTVAQRPGNPRAHNNLGVALARAGREAEAVDAFRQAVRLQPDYGDAYGNLGGALNAMGQADEAITVQRQALVLAPEDAEKHYNLGNAQLQTGDQAGAAASFRRAIGLQPNLYPALGNLALLLMDQGDLAGAEPYIEQMRQVAPQVMMGPLLLGDLRLKQGRRPEALAFYQEALSLQPDSPEILERLKAARVEEGK